MEELIRELIVEIRALRLQQSLDWRSLNRSEAADYLGIYPDTLYKLAVNGKVAYHQSGRCAQMFFSRADLDDYRESTRQSAAV